MHTDSPGAAVGRNQIRRQLIAGAGLIPTGEFEDRSIPVMAGLVPAISGQFPAKPYESTNPPVGISRLYGTYRITELKAV